MKKLLLVFLLQIAFVACEKDKKEISPEITTIPMSFDVDRFDLKFAEATPENLPSLKQQYPYLFPARYDDQFWLDKLNDTVQNEINAEVTKAFPDFKAEGENLLLLFKHFKYYFPQFKSPDIITVTSQVDYRNKVIASDSLMLIALDTYLGDEHYFYEGISQYIAKNLRREQMVTDVATEYVTQLLGGNSDREFMGQMVYYGKLLYMIEQLAPFIEEEEMIGYTKEELEWAMANESEIWRYFVDSKLLYSTNPKLAGRFLNPAPFSKFYLELDNESPGMLGRYLGWQIVRSYMRNNDVSLRDLIGIDAKTLFQNAKFKPKK